VRQPGVGEANGPDITVFIFLELCSEYPQEADVDDVSTELSLLAAKTRAPAFIGLLVNRFIHHRVTWLLRCLPLTAMAAICVIMWLTVAMARKRDPPQLATCRFSAPKHS